MLGTKTVCFTRFCDRGYVNESYLPIHRGFSHSHGFLAGGEDHFTQLTQKCDWGSTTDLWEDDGPSVDCNVPTIADRSKCPQYYIVEKANGTQVADAMCKAGKFVNCAAADPAEAERLGAWPCYACKPKRYTGYDFAAKAVEYITNHDHASGPFFLYLALHNTHGPIEAPEEWVSLYNFDLAKRNTFDAMISVVDSTVKNVTLALHESSQWTNTLMIWTTGRRRVSSSTRASILTNRTLFALLHD